MGTSRSHMGWSALAVAVLLSSAFFPGCGRTPRHGERFLTVFGGDSEVLRDAPPQYHVGLDAAPFLILYAHRDVEFMAERATGSHAALGRAGVDAEVHEESDRNQESDRNHITSVASMGTVGDAATSQMVDFVSGVAGAKEQAR